jgi:CheY-like chemotaxis protein
MLNQTLSCLRILTVDDVPALRRLIGHLLAGQGCEEIFEAESVATAWQLLETQKFDVMLLDYDLSHESGLKLARRLRADRMALNHDLPIIMLTGYVKVEALQESLRAGADAYIVKPVMPEALGERILAVLASRKKLAEQDAAANPASDGSWGRS